MPDYFRNLNENRSNVKAIALLSPSCTATRAIILVSGLSELYSDLDFAKTNDVGLVSMFTSDYVISLLNLAV